MRTKEEAEELDMRERVAGEILRNLGHKPTAELVQMVARYPGVIDSVRNYLRRR